MFWMAAGGWSRKRAVEVQKAREALGWSRGNPPAVWSWLVSAPSSSFLPLYPQHHSDLKSPYFHSFLEGITTHLVRREKHLI